MCAAVPISLRLGAVGVFLEVAERRERWGSPGMVNAS
jgi:hypothetical protein